MLPGSHCRENGPAGTTTWTKKAPARRKPFFTEAALAKFLTVVIRNSKIFVRQNPVKATFHFQRKIRLLCCERDHKMKHVRAAREGRFGGCEGLLDRESRSWAVGFFH